MPFQNSAGVTVEGYSWNCYGFRITTMDHLRENCTYMGRVVDSTLSSVKAVEQIFKHVDDYLGLLNQECDGAVLEDICTIFADGWGGLCSLPSYLLGTLSGPERQLGNEASIFMLALQPQGSESAVTVQFCPFQKQKLLCYDWCLG